jgi:hypothetical protein
MEVMLCSQHGRCPFSSLGSKCIAAQESKVYDCSVKLPFIDINMIAQLVVPFWNEQVRMSRLIV